MSLRSRPLSSPALQALLVTFLWSTSWVLIKLGLSDDLPPLTFAGLRYTLAAVVLSGVLAASPASRRQLVATSWPVRGRLIALGLVMYALTQGAQFIGLDLLPAATLSLLLTFTPVVVTLGSVRFAGEEATGRQWVGMMVAAVGAAIYLGPDIGVTSALGLGVGLVGLASNAGASLLGRVVNRDASLSPLVVTAPSMAVGGAATLVTGMLLDGLPQLTPATWGIVIWLAVVNTAFAFTLWNRTLQSLTATESAAINNTMLVQIAVLAWLVLGEELTGVQWSGLLVVSAGIWLVRRRASNWRRRPFAGVVSGPRGLMRRTRMKADAATTDAVLDAVRSFMAAYEAKDVDGVMAHFAPDDDVVLIGTGADEKRIGPSQVRLQVTRDYEQTDKIAMRLGDPMVSARGDVAWLSGDLTFDGVAEGQAFVLPGRFTAVFEKRGDAWLMVNTHVSAPMADQAEGESFPS